MTGMPGNEKPNPNPNFYQQATCIVAGTLRSCTSDRLGQLRSRHEEQTEKETYFPCKHAEEMVRPYDNQILL